MSVFYDPFLHLDDTDLPDPEDLYICGYPLDVWSSFSADEQDAINMKWEHDMLHHLDLGDCEVLE